MQGGGRTVQVKIPDNWTPGKNLVVNLGGQQVKLTPPAGSVPGQVLTVRVQAPSSSAPSQQGLSAGLPSSMPMGMAQKPSQDTVKENGNETKTAQEKKKEKRRRRRKRKQRNAALKSNVAMDIAFVTGFAALTVIGYLAVRHMLGRSS